MSKLLYLIRHGYSLHNQIFVEMGYNVNAFRIPEVIDSPLTGEGQRQSIDLGHQWSDKHNIELVVVSPLMRALETAVNIFGDTNIPIICQEYLREYPIGRDTCNLRSDRDILQRKFPSIDFSSIHYNKDILWKAGEENMETIDALNSRISLMKDYLSRRPETKIAVVGHSSYIGHFKDNFIPLIENGDEELKYCYPYEYELK
jgi:broad specificity phosphatase PhoE